MEMIQGKPLIDYANSKKLNTRQRLALMVQICEAVQHAHERGIIHRDLKPGNILVDETGQPKILDFGLARVTDSDVQATRQTDMGQLLGTLPYMSPEQVTADPTALDTRSDVYALGVILYELLAGKLPYPVSRQLHEVVQTIQQVDPSPLRSVNRVYRGDIETIVGKALEKDKTRRYSSAANLGTDIQRYLEDWPITAKPASTSYQLQKFARRHKALVASVGVVFLVLVAATVVSVREAIRQTVLRRPPIHSTTFCKTICLPRQVRRANWERAQSQTPISKCALRSTVPRSTSRESSTSNPRWRPPFETPSVEPTIWGYTPRRENKRNAHSTWNAESLGAENPKTLQTMTRVGHAMRLEGKQAAAETVPCRPFRCNAVCWVPNIPTRC